MREGITWENIQYFNNKVICDLIEETHKGIICLIFVTILIYLLQITYSIIDMILGIIAFLDEECLRPGDPTDISFLEKLNKHLHVHPHYISHIKADIKTQKIMGRDV